MMNYLQPGTHTLNWGRRGRPPLCDAKRPKTGDYIIKRLQAGSCKKASYLCSCKKAERGGLTKLASDYMNDNYRLLRVDVHN